MRLANKSLLSAFTAATLFWSTTKAKTDAVETPRVEIKLLSKPEFLGELENKKNLSLLLIYHTYKLKKQEIADRDREILTVSKEIAENLSHLGKTVKIGLIKEEDAKVALRGWEATLKSTPPIDLDSEKELRVFLKKPDTEHIYTLTNDLGDYKLDTLRNYQEMRSLRKSIERLSRPVVEVKTAAELRRELTRHLGIPNRPLLIDVVDGPQMTTEHAYLTQYFNGRYKANSIHPDTRILLVDSKLIPHPALVNKITYVANDFKTLTALHSACSASQDLSCDNPSHVATTFSSILLDQLRPGPGSAGIPSFSAGAQAQTNFEALDSIQTPEAPVFTDPTSPELDRFYEHVFRNKDKKLLCLFTDKHRDPLAEQRMQQVMQDEGSKRRLAYAVFVGNGFSRYLKEINPLYSPLCLVDLSIGVGNTHQRLFADLQKGKTHEHFMKGFEELIKRSSDPNETDLVQYYPDALQTLSSKSFEVFQSMFASKHRIVLVGTDERKLHAYQSYLLGKYGADSSVRLAQILPPDRLPSDSYGLSKPALVVTPKNSTLSPKVFILPEEFDYEQQESIERLLNTTLASVLSSN